MVLNEINLSNLSSDKFWEIVVWCRETYGGYTYGYKWEIDVKTWTLSLSDDYYTLFVLRWT